MLGKAELANELIGVVLKRGALGSELVSLGVHKLRYILGCHLLAGRLSLSQLDKKRLMLIVSNE